MLGTFVGLCSKVVRLNIAQVLTVIRQTQLKTLREAYKSKARLSDTQTTDGCRPNWAVPARKHVYRDVLFYRLFIFSVLRAPLGFLLHFM